MPLINPVIYDPTSKYKSSSRVKNAASGDVSYTSIGFTPSCIIFLALDNNSGFSIGFADENLDEGILYHTEAGTWASANDQCIRVDADGANAQYAVLKSMDSDGFTLTWTKQGAGSTSDANLRMICIK